MFAPASGETPEVIRGICHAPQLLLGLLSSVSEVDGLIAQAKDQILYRSSYDENREDRATHGVYWRIASKQKA